MDVSLHEQIMNQNQTVEQCRIQESSVREFEFELRWHKLILYNLAGGRHECLYQMCVMIFPSIVDDGISLWTETVRQTNKP